MMFHFHTSEVQHRLWNRVCLLVVDPRNLFGNIIGTHVDRVVILCLKTGMKLILPLIYRAPMIVYDYSCVSVVLCRPIHLRRDDLVSEKTSIILSSFVSSRAARTSCNQHFLS